MNDSEVLKANPIFAMSLSSKELFHSNFWAWLFERDIAYAKIFFNSITNVVKVEREKKHRDVTIWQSTSVKNKSTVLDDAYIIENKFKSLPDKEQLLRYQEALEAPKTKTGKIKTGSCSNMVQGVITGIIEPDFLDDPELNKWAFISYKQIGEKIIEVANRIESDGFEKRLIVEYAETIIELQQLIIDSLNNNGEKWNSYNKNCSELRMNDVYSKLLAAGLTRYLNENLSVARNVGNYELLVKQYYGLNGAGADIRYVCKDKHAELSKIGIQIEGNQYRWITQKEKKHDKYDKKCEEFYELARGYNWFVDYNHLLFAKGEQKVLIDHLDNTKKRKTGMGKDKTPHSYNVYTLKNKQEEYTFLYQYWLLSGESFKEICDIVQRDMEFAKTIIEKLET